MPLHIITRDKNFLSKNDENVGMKKAQKQDIIQNGTIFVILYPFLHVHSTQYYSYIIDHSNTSWEVKTLDVLTKKVVGVNTLASLPYYNLPAQILILKKHHPSIILLGQ